MAGGTPIATQWRVGAERTLTLDRPRLMGIVNVTPDSFSDGGMHSSVDQAVEYVLKLVEEGACVIDIGGESTRPGAARVSAEEQIRRTQPVIEKLRRRSEVLISIDTTLSEVAKAALSVGANIINDVSAGQEDPQILQLAADHACGLILMHRLRPPNEDSFSHDYAKEPQYEDVVREVRKFLLQRAEQAQNHGIDPEAIVLDPGLGFGKSVDQNFQLIVQSDALVSTGYPILGAASRKSFIGKLSGVECPSDRVNGSVAANVVQYLAGVRLFRVHDVAAQFQALRVTHHLVHVSKDTGKTG